MTDPDDTGPLVLAPDLTEDRVRGRSTGTGTMPKYIMTPNSGWDSRLGYGNGALQDRILWGSNWPMIEPAASIEWIRKFPLKDDVKRKWLGGNAAALLRV
jgi:predicted TIM-barrel fold metal-dependent hydrolase